MWRVFFSKIFFLSWRETEIGIISQVSAAFRPPDERWKRAWSKGGGDLSDSGIMLSQGLSLRPLPSLGRLLYLSSR